MNMRHTSLPAQSDWYQSDQHDPDIQVADEAFIAAKKILSDAARSSKEKARLAVLDGAGTVHELMDLVTDTSKRYEAKKEKSRVRQYMVAFSRKVMNYREVVDVFVSSHPEYAALVWGTMKLFFMAVVNHEELVVAVLEGLLAIGGVLPGCEVTTALFPTAAMKRGLSEIYADILTFLMRALAWFEENRIVRAMKSITKPRGLRYDDILEKITKATIHLRQLAATASQAEMRDMHILQLEMNRAMPSQSQVEGLQLSVASIASSVPSFQSQITANRALLEHIDKSMSIIQAQAQEGPKVILERMSGYHEMQMSAHINTNAALTDLQFSNIMSSLEQTRFKRPDRLLQTALVLANRNRRVHGALIASGMRPVPVWETPIFQAWGSTAQKLSLVTMSGPPSSRLAVRAFLATAIDCIRASGVPVLWALHGIDPASDRARISLVDIVRYLAHQAMRCTVSNTERSMAITSQRILAARDDDCHEWIKILAAIVRQLRVVYIVVDADVFSNLDSNHIPDSDEPASPDDLFTALFDETAAAGQNVVVKVLLTAYGPTSSTSSGRTHSGLAQPPHIASINVGGPRVPASRARLVSRVRGRGAMRAGIQRAMTLRRGKH